MNPRLLPVPDGLVGERADVALARMTGLSRSRVGELCGRGDVRLGGAALSKSERLPEGAVLEVELPGPRPARPAPTPVEDMVHFSVQMDLQKLVRNLGCLFVQEYLI